ncbi:hypothetical protein NE663_07015, partial [Massilicoli timonensis]
IAGLASVKIALRRSFLPLNEAFFYVQTAITFSSSMKNRVCFLLFSFDQGEILVQHYFHYFLI